MGDAHKALPRRWLDRFGTLQQGRAIP